MLVPLVNAELEEGGDQVQAEEGGSLVWDLPLDVCGGVEGDAHPVGPLVDTTEIYYQAKTPLAWLQRRQ